jgi:hypothetical protein
MILLNGWPFEIINMQYKKMENLRKDEAGWEMSFKDERF